MLAAGSLKSKSSSRRHRPRVRSLIAGVFSEPTIVASVAIVASNPAGARCHRKQLGMLLPAMRV